MVVGGDGATATRTKHTGPHGHDVQVLHEEQLRLKDVISPDDVLQLTAPTTRYLCPPSKNTYKIDFTRFKLRDLDSDSVLFEMVKPPNPKATDENEFPPFDPEDFDVSWGRSVRYHFTANFLRLKNVGATIEFTVGNTAVSRFRMIERHFFRDTLLKSFDFEFPFCMPFSRNTCEHIYEFPSLSEEDVQKMIDAPFETRSDSFYFVEDRLIMHNKAEYAYGTAGEITVEAP